MSARKACPNPMAIARWRYDQIESALGPMTHDVRGQIIHDIHRVPVQWPSGRVKPISLSSLYRWIERYEEKGLAGLRPTRRKDLGRQRARLTADVVAKARELLEEDPEISWTLLVVLLNVDGELRLAQCGIQTS